MAGDLNNAKLQLFHRLYEQIDSAVKRAITFYTKEADRVGLVWRERTWYDGDIDRVDYDGVVIKWDEYRRNCHVDGGRFDLPWEALADATYQSYITDLVAKQATKKLAESEVEKARQLAYKRSQLAQLKAELGEK